MVRRTNDTVNIREKVEYPRVLPLHAIHIWVMIMCGVHGSKVPVAGISSDLQLSGLCPSSLLFHASVTKKIMAHCPSHPAKVSKTPIMVNPLAHSLSGE